MTFSDYYLFKCSAGCKISPKMSYFFSHTNSEHDIPGAEVLETEKQAVLKTQTPDTY